MKNPKETNHQNTSITDLLLMSPPLPSPHPHHGSSSHVSTSRISLQPLSRNPFLPLPPVPARGEGRKGPYELGLAMGAWSKRATSPDKTVALPLQSYRPVVEDGSQARQYWPFSSADLNTWKAQHSPLSDKPKGLINFFETVLFSHQPTWDDIQ